MATPDLSGLGEAERTAIIREAMAQLAERGRSSVAAPLEQQEAEETARTQRAAEARGGGADAFSGLDLGTILGGQAAQQRGITLEDIQALLASQNQDPGLLDATGKRNRDIDDVIRLIDNPTAPVGGP